MKKLPKTPQIGIPSSSSRTPYFTVKKKTPRSSSRNFSKKSAAFYSNATEQALHDQSKIQIISRASLQRSAENIQQGSDHELAEAPIICQHQASHHGVQLITLKNRRQAYINIELRGNASVTNFSNKYEISSLFTSRKAASKSGSGNCSGRNTSLGTSHDRVINLVSKQDMQNHLEINTSLNANTQSIFRKNQKKGAKRADSQQKSHPKFSKNSLYLNPLVEHNHREMEPMTPTFEDPLLIPFGNSTPSSPHQHAGVVKLITSLESTRRITKSQNFATEPRRAAGNSTQHQFSPTSTEIGDQRLSRNETQNRSSSNMYERSVDTIVQDQEMSNHIQPILEQQHLIAGDNALSAIQSNESFEMQQKEAIAPSKFKNYLSNNNRSSAAHLQQKKKEQEEKGSQSAKQIISVTVTPAMSNLSAEHRRKSLKMMASPVKKSSGNKLPLKMKSVDRKNKLKSVGPSLAPRNKNKVQQKSMQDISPNSDMTSPLDYKVQDCDQKFYMNNSMQRGHSAAHSINQDIRELSLTLQGIARKSHQDLKQAVDQSLNRDVRADQRKERYSSHSGMTNLKSKNRLNSQYYQQWVNDGGVTTTMDTTDQISGLSLKKGPRDTKRKKSPTMPGTQFEILATKLKKQILGGQVDTGNLLAKNPNSLPTTPRHCIDNNSQIYKNQLHNSPDSIRSQMLRDAMHKMPNTARPRYASSSLSYYKFPDFVKKQPFFRQVVHLNNDPKEGNTMSGQSTPKLYNNNSHSESKIMPLKSSFLDTRCPSTTLLLQEDEKTKTTSVASLSPIGKRRNKRAVHSRGADGLYLIQKRVMTMLGWYSQKVLRMQNEINELKSENTTLKNIYCRGSSTLSPPPLSAHTHEEVLQYSVEMSGPRIEGAMTPQPTSTTQPLLYFKPQAPTPPDRHSQIQVPLEAWNSSLEASRY